MTSLDILAYYIYSRPNDLLESLYFCCSPWNWFQFTWRWKRRWRKSTNLSSKHQFLSQCLYRALIYWYFCWWQRSVSRYPRRYCFVFAMLYVNRGALVSLPSAWPLLPIRSSCLCLMAWRDRAEVRDLNFNFWVKKILSISKCKISHSLIITYKSTTFSHFKMRPVLSKANIRFAPVSDCYFELHVDFTMHVEVHPITSGRWLRYLKYDLAKIQRFQNRALKIIIDMWKFEVSGFLLANNFPWLTPSNT